MHDIEELRKELLDKLRFLRNSYEGSKKPSIVFLLSAISKYACEEKIKYLLEKQDPSEFGKRFDPYYRLKSDFATLKILELLKSRLQANGLEAIILTEVSNDMGRYDIAIVQGPPCEVYDCTRLEKVRIEVKASLGLDFEQLNRYLWDSSPLILARVMTRHVVKLKPSSLRSYINFSLKELNSKTDRLIANKVYKIPGKDCASCPNANCSHYCNRLWKAQKMISMSEKEFNDDLDSFFDNLSYVAEKTVNLAMEELKK